jgi:hypothetical protein
VVKLSPFRILIPPKIIKPRVSEEIISALERKWSYKGLF